MFLLINLYAYFVLFSSFFFKFLLFTQFKASDFSVLLICLWFFCCNFHSSFPLEILCICYVFQRLFSLLFLILYFTISLVLIIFVICVILIVFACKKRIEQSRNTYTSSSSNLELNGHIPLAFLSALCDGDWLIC